MSTVYEPGSDHTEAQSGEAITFTDHTTLPAANTEPTGWDVHVLPLGRRDKPLVSIVPRETAKAHDTYRTIFMVTGVILVLMLVVGGILVAASSHLSIMAFMSLWLAVCLVGLLVAAFSMHAFYRMNRRQPITYHDSELAAALFDKFDEHFTTDPNDVVHAAEVLCADLDLLGKRRDTLLKLLKDPEFGPKARALVEQAAETDDPKELDRLRAKVDGMGIARDVVAEQRGDNEVGWLELDD